MTTVILNALLARSFRIDQEAFTQNHFFTPIKMVQLRLPDRFSSSHDRFKIAEGC
jgi:hypothetical protein